MREAPAGVREAALVGFLWSTGLRIKCEALKITLRDLDPVHHKVHVRNGRGGKAHWAPWMSGVGLSCSLGSGFALGTPRGRCPASSREGRRGVKPMGPSAFRTKLRKIQRDAGITTRVHPHAFRHSMAHDYFRTSGVDLEQMRQALGHDSLATTALYRGRSLRPM